MKIVAMMPIKLNNKRFPGKNIKPLNGKPLLLYNLTMLQSIREIDEIYVYCSDEAICSFLPQNVIFLKRPKFLDSDRNNFTQFFESFMAKVDADIYVCSHATAPFVSVQTTQKCIQSVLSGKYDSAFTATKLQDFLWTSHLTPLNFDADNLPRSQDLESYYRETSGIYVFKKEVFKNYKTRVGKNPNIVEVSFKESIDINEEEDFRLAEILCQTKTANMGGGGRIDV